MVFEDPFALAWTDQVSRIVIRTQPLRWLLFSILLRPLHPVGAQIIARSRYTEDQLNKAIAAD